MNPSEVILAAIEKYFPNEVQNFKELIKVQIETNGEVYATVNPVMLVDHTSCNVTEHSIAEQQRLELLDAEMPGMQNVYDNYLCQLPDVDSTYTYNFDNQFSHDFRYLIYTYNGKDFLAIQFQHITAADARKFWKDFFIFDVTHAEVDTIFFIDIFCYLPQSKTTLHSTPSGWIVDEIDGSLPVEIVEASYKDFFDVKDSVVYEKGTTEEVSFFLIKDGLIVD